MPIMHIKNLYIKPLTALTALIMASTACVEGEIQTIGDSESGSFVSGQTTVPTGSSTSSGNAVTVTPDIVEVSFIVEAEEWTDFDINKRPFGDNSSRGLLGDTFIWDGSIRNTNFPAEFNFDYPDTNFQLSRANLIIDTLKDSSDTEGIWIDGMFSGIPPSVNAGRYTSADGFPNAADWFEVYAYTPLPTANYYYVVNGFQNYVIDKRNTFDFDIREAIKNPNTTDAAAQDAEAFTTLFDNLKDDNLKIVLGDDSPIFKAYLVVTGFTVASNDLQCTNSDVFTMSNSLLHRDGGTTSSVITGNACDSDSASANSCDSSRFYFDQKFPNVPDENITITSSTIDFLESRQSNSALADRGQIRINRKNDNAPVAVILSGLGVAEPAFNKASVDASVEWLPDQSIGLDNAAGFETNFSLDLVSLFGADRLKEKLLEGALNVELAGAVIQNVDDSATRGYGESRAGPELSIAGTYFARVCQIEDDPNSPLSEAGLGAITVDNGQAPTISSVQVTEVTNDSAKIVWLTDEVASSKVLYGVGSTSENEYQSPSSATRFHEVVITGLSNYTTYQIQVESVDIGGNGSVSNIVTFLTKR